MSKEQSKKWIDIKRNVKFLNISYKRYKFRIKNHKEIK